jgi:[acyl-carrier-protein] S-malonyltransferase
MQTFVSVPTTMKAIIICGDHLSDIEATMPSISANLPNPSTDLVEIANINSNAQVVLSGTRSGVDYACAVLQAKGYAGRAVELPVSAPFHCALMQPAAEKLTEVIAKIRVQEPVIPVISNVTAQPMHAADIPSLLVSQMTKTVQWQRSIEYCRNSGMNETGNVMKSDNAYDWTVVGPSRVLSNLLKKEFPGDKVLGLVGLSDLNEAFTRT